MKKTILIVDDDNAVRESLKKLLDESGYLVVLAANGRDGLARLKHRHIDLLLLDLNLPKISGFDILDVAAERCPLVPIIILTGLIGQCEPGALVGADALLEKPPDVSLLLHTIAKLVSEPAERRIHRLLGSPGGAHPAPRNSSLRLSLVPPQAPEAFPGAGVRPRN